MARTVWAAISVAVGIALGAGGGYAVATSTVEPEIVTKTQTVSETETVEVVPEVCLDALDAAGMLQQMLIEKWTGSLDLLLEGSPDTVVDDVERLTDTTELDEATDQWWESHDDCRTAAS